MGCSSLSHSRWARRWINHWSLWHMASASPDIWLPSQPQGITALWPVPNCTAWWQRHMGVNNLPRVVAWRYTDRESNPGPLEHESDLLTTTPPSHQSPIIIIAVVVTAVAMQCGWYIRSDLSHSSCLDCSSLDRSSIVCSACTWKNKTTIKMSVSNERHHKMNTKAKTSQPGYYVTMQ